MTFHMNGLPSIINDSHEMPSYFRKSYFLLKLNKRKKQQET